MYDKYNIDIYIRNDQQNMYDITVPNLLTLPVSLNPQQMPKGTSY